MILILCNITVKSYCVMLALFQTAVIVGDFAAILEVNICEDRDCTPLS